MSNKKIKRSQRRFYYKIILLDILLEKYGPICPGCMRYYSRRLTPTIDHKIPKSKGGLNTLDNVWLLCGPCNSNKGSSDLDEWLSRKKKEYYDSIGKNK